MYDSTRITYYDFGDLLYSSYYLAGFAQNTSRFHYQFTVSKSPCALANGTPPEWAYVLLFKAKMPHDEFYFCVDTLDSNRAGSDWGCGYQVSLLDKVRYYFKVNYSEEAIAEETSLQRFTDRIIPVLPFFPVKVPQSLRYLPRPTSCRATGWTVNDALKRLKHLRDIPTLKHILQLRRITEDLDLFFVVNFSGKKEHSENDEYRYRVMRAIQQRGNLNAKFGFVSRHTIPGKFSDFPADRLPLTSYLDHLARAKVAIYIRGLHDCISFKFGQLMALGKPIVGQPIMNNRENIMSYDHFDDQFRFEDPEELVSHAVDLLDDPKRRLDLGGKNATSFDNQFTPSKVVSDILTQIGLREAL